MTALPFVDLAAQQARIRERLDAAIARVLDHGQYIMGPEVAELETKLAAFSGVRHCIGVSSGTDALVAPLMALGIGQGDAVFMPAFTFTATAEVVVLLGATPVFVDVENATFNIDPGSLEAKIDEVRGAGSFVPKALIPVDLFGLPADYRALSALAEAHGLTVIADAAQSFGGALDGERVGRLAPVTATSKENACASSSGCKTSLSIVDVIFIPPKSALNELVNSHENHTTGNHGEARPHARPVAQLIPGDRKSHGALRPV